MNIAEIEAIVAQAEAGDTSRLLLLCGVADWSLVPRLLVARVHAVAMKWQPPRPLRVVKQLRRATSSSE